MQFSLKGFSPIFSMLQSWLCSQAGFCLLFFCLPSYLMPPHLLAFVSFGISISVHQLRGLIYLSENVLSVNPAFPYE